MAFHEETRKLRVLYNNTDVYIDYSTHAQEEMRVDKISRSDIEKLLASSPVTDVQPGGRWRVSGRDLNGRDIETIIVPYEDEIVIVVVTAWKRK